MIISLEYYADDGRLLVVTRSDQGMKIRQNETGAIYDMAIDVPNKYTYSETDIPVELDEE